MNLKALVVLAIAGAAVSACAEKQPMVAASSTSQRQITVYNDSGTTMAKLFRSTPGAGAWLPSALGTRVLRDGHSARIDLAEGSEKCNFDFRAVFADGTTTTQYDVDVCANGSVTVL